MKSILMAACILGMAVCAPHQMYMEFDIRYAPAQALEAIPAGAPLDSLDVLLPVDDQKQLLGGPVRGFIKQEIRQPNGRESKDVYYAFGFDPADPAAAAPVAPVAPVAPIAPVVPVAPAAPAAAAAAAPVQPAVAAAPVARRMGDDDDDDD